MRRVTDYPQDIQDEARGAVAEFLAYVKAKRAKRPAPPKPKGKQPRIYITHNGHTRSLLQWQQATGIPAQTIRMRMRRYGWSAAKALTTPVHTPFRAK